MEVGYCWVSGKQELTTNQRIQYTVCGVDKPEKVEQEIIGTLRSVTKFNVPILARIELYEVDNMNVLGLYVPSSPNKPVYLNNNLNNTFIRIGSGDQRATDVEIDILMREKSFGTKSEMPIDGTSFADINSSSLQTYRKRVRDFNEDFKYNDLDDENFCHKIGVTYNGKLTYGGLLMFGKGDVVKQYVRNFWIDYIEIPGETVHEANCRYNYRMPEQENIWEYFKVLFQRLRLYVDNPFMAGPDGFSPEDNSQLYCIREGLVNMLAHADYFSPMHSVIRVYSNRLELQNPGKFPIQINPKPEILKSIPRNPNIIAFFRYARQGENAGYGIDKIIKWSEITGESVTFMSDTISSTVTYYLPSRGGQKPQQKGEEQADNKELSAEKGGQKKVVRKGGQKKRGATKEQILEILRKNPQISRKELSAVIGISQSAIQKHLNSLKNDEVIIRVGSVGSARKGQWKILQ